MTDEQSPWEGAGIQNAADMEQIETSISNLATMSKQFFSELRAKPNPMTRAEALQLTNIWMATMLINGMRRGA